MYINLNKIVELEKNLAAKNSIFAIVKRTLILNIKNKYDVFRLHTYLRQVEEFDQLF